MGRRKRTWSGPRFGEVCPIQIPGHRHQSSIPHPYVLLRSAPVLETWRGRRSASSRDRLDNLIEALISAAMSRRRSRSAPSRDQGGDQGQPPLPPRSRSGEWRCAQTSCKPFCFSPERLKQTKILAKATDPCLPVVQTSCKPFCEPLSRPCSSVLCQIPLVCEPLSDTIVYLFTFFQIDCTQQRISFTLS